MEHEMDLEVEKVADNVEPEGLMTDERTYHL
jgi:hypothetical protein